MKTIDELNKLREYVGEFGKLSEIEINKDIIEDIEYYDRYNKILRTEIIKRTLSED